MESLYRFRNKHGRIRPNARLVRKTADKDSTREGTVNLRRCSFTLPMRWTFPSGSLIIESPVRRSIKKIFGELSYS